MVYDVTFALVWADQDAALNRNEAYALASCRDCRTVAVAFQVVLLVGSVDVVVPQNLAAAVNYACVECVTYALATQLVVSLPGPLSEGGARDLAAIWAELAEFGKQIEGVPLAELRDRLTEYEARILAVVRADAEESGTAEQSGTDTAADEPDPSERGSPDDRIHQRRGDVGHADRDGGRHGCGHVRYGARGDHGACLDELRAGRGHVGGGVVDGHGLSRPPSSTPDGRGEWPR